MEMDGGRVVGGLIEVGDGWRRDRRGKRVELLIKGGYLRYWACSVLLGMLFNTPFS